MVELLATYPQEVLQEVIHPYKGLPGKHKFMPSIAEVREFCDTVAAQQSKPSRSEPKSAPAPKTEEEFCKLYNIPCIPNGWTHDKVRKIYERSGETYLRQFVSEALEGYVRKGAH